MGCLEVNFERLGGDLDARFERMGGMDVSFSPVCGTGAGLTLLVDSEHDILTDSQDEFLTATND